MDKYLETIKKSKLFANIDTADLTSTLSCLGATTQSYKKGSYIFRIGDKISSIGIVLSGSVIIINEDFWGNRTILSEISAGGIFGEAFACTDDGKVHVNTNASSDSVIMLLDIKRVLTTCQNSCKFHSRLVRNLVGVLADKNVVLFEKIVHISQRKLRDKILSYLSECSKKEHNSSFTIAFDRQELADYLSCDRTALSNELSKLRNEGIIKFEKNKFSLL